MAEDGQADSTRSIRLWQLRRQLKGSSKGSETLSDGTEKVFTTLVQSTAYPRLRATVEEAPTYKLEPALVRIIMVRTQGSV